ncbi:hypothetical protein MUK42_36214, partial [Musa troglodytarum]
PVPPRFLPLFSFFLFFFFFLLPVLLSIFLLKSAREIDRHSETISAAADPLRIGFPGIPRLPLVAILTVLSIPCIIPHPPIPFPPPSGETGAKRKEYLLKIVNPCTPRVLPHSTGVAGHHPLSIIVFGAADTVDDPVIYAPFLPELSQTLVDPKEPSSHPSCPVGTEQGLDGSHVTGFFMVE